MSESQVIQLDIAGDSSDAVSSLNDMASALDHLQSTVETTASSMESAGNTVGTSFDGAATALGSVGDEAEGAAGHLEAAGREAQGAESGMEGLKGASEGAQGAIGNLASEASGPLAEGFNAASEGVEALIGEGEGIGLAGLVGVAGAAATALFGIGKEGGDLVTEMMQISGATGLSIEDADKLSLAFEDVGSNASLLIRLGGMLTTTITQAADATAKHQDLSAKASVVVKDLGVKIFDTNGHLRDQGEVLQDVLQRLGNMTDKQEAARLTVELFGSRMAGQVIPVVQNYNQVMQKAAEQSEVLAGGMTNAQEKAIKFHEGMTDLKVEGENLGLKTLPALQQALTGMEPLADAFAGDWHKAGEDISKMWEEDTMIRPIYEWEEKVRDSVREKIGSIPDELKSDARGLWQDAGGLWSDLESKFTGHGKEAANKFATGFAEDNAANRTVITAGVDNMFRDVWATADDSGSRFATAWATAAAGTMAKAAPQAFPGNGQYIGSGGNPNASAFVSPAGAIGTENDLQWPVGSTIPHYAMGSSRIPRSGLAYVHAGESISRLGSGGGGVNVHIHGGTFGSPSESQAQVESIASAIVQAVRIRGGAI